MSGIKYPRYLQRMEFAISEGCDMVDLPQPESVTRKDSAVVQLVVHPKDGRILGANADAVKLYGYAYDVLLGMSIFSLGALPCKNIQELSDMVAKGGEQPVFFTFPESDDGGDVQEVYFVESASPEEYAIYITILEGEKKKIESSGEQDSEDIYRLFFEHEHDSALIFDIDTLEIISANSKASSLYGYSQKELTQISVLQVATDPKAVAQNLAHLKNIGSLHLLQRYHRNRSGELLPVEVQASTFRYRNRHLGCAIVRDISARLEHERTLAEAVKKASDANQAKSAFLTNMSHEIRTPLNGLLGILQLLRVSCEKNENRELVEMALGSGGKLLSLLTDLLDLSHIESGAVGINIVPFSLRGLVDSVIQLNRVAALEQCTTLEVEYAFTLPDVVEGPEQQILQILGNLVANAIKFTEGGSVTVRVPSLESVEEKTVMKFIIEDTRYDVPDIPHVTRLDALPEVTDFGYPQPYGAGLDLHIAQALIDLIGGEVVLHSRKNCGTSITVIVPIQPSRSTFSKDEEETGSESMPSYRVLLIEDDLVTQMATQGLLERRGIYVACAEGPEEGFARLQEESFDLILMDIQMPVMDGTQAAQKIRSGIEGVPQDIPIIALTAHAFTDDKARCFEAGMNGYLSKPVNMDELLVEMQRVLGGDK